MNYMKSLETLINEIKNYVKCNLNARILQEIIVYLTSINKDGKKVQEK